jgi:phosphatase NudJ
MAEVIPVKNKILTQPFVIVGVIIEKDGKFLLVQEANLDKGTWNQPAGWLDLGEDIVAGAKREAEEETGIEIEITGFLGVWNYANKSQPTGEPNHAVKFIFTAKPLSDNLKIQEGEIMDAKWFTFDEIKQMKDQLRSMTIIEEIEDFVAGKCYPLDFIKPFTTYYTK